jgi:hypothetical protein
MTGGWDEVLTAIIGYVTVPLVSLATRRNWRDEYRFLAAAALAAAGAALAIFATGLPFNGDSFSEAFGLAFVAQQATWHLALPGAGSRAVNERLEDVGSHYEAEGEYEESDISPGE